VEVVDWMYLAQDRDQWRVIVNIVMISLDYEDVTKSFRTESIMKYMLTTTNTRSEATRSVMAAKLTKLTHKIAIQLHLVAESMYHLQFSLQAANPETFGYVLVYD
jgi:hypothetical protein